MECCNKLGWDKNTFLWQIFTMNSMSLSCDKLGWDKLISTEPSWKWAAASSALFKACSSWASRSSSWFEVGGATYFFGLIGTPIFLQLLMLWLVWSHLSHVKSDNFLFILCPMTLSSFASLLLSFLGLPLWTFLCGGIGCAYYVWAQYCGPWTGSIKWWYVLL